MQAQSSHSPKQKRMDQGGGGGKRRRNRGGKGRRGGGGGGGGGNASPMSGRSVSSPRSFSSMAGALGFRRGFRDGVLMCTALVCWGLASGSVEPRYTRRRNRRNALDLATKCVPKAVARKKPASVSKTLAAATRNSSYPRPSPTS